jgi:hypothetical protein
LELTEPDSGQSPYLKAQIYPILAKLQNPVFTSAQLPFHQYMGVQFEKIKGGLKETASDILTA